MQIRSLWIIAAACSVGILIVLANVFTSDLQTPGTERDQSAEADQEAEDSLIEFVQTPWIGDLDGMLERRLIRVLTVPTETSYFLEKGETRGITAEFISAFENFINKRFPPKARHPGVRVVVVQTSNSDIFPALLNGRGDIATARLTITEQRKDQVDFSNPSPERSMRSSLQDPPRQR